MSVSDRTRGGEKYVFTIMSYVGSKYMGTLTTSSWGMAMGYISGMGQGAAFGGRSLPNTKARFRVFVDGEEADPEALQEHLDKFAEIANEVLGG